MAFEDRWILVQDYSDSLGVACSEANASSHVRTVSRECGHESVDVPDIGLGAAKDPVIARHAPEHGLCLVTADWGFADVRAYPPAEYRGIVVLGLPDDAIAPQIGEMVRVLLSHAELLTHLPGRLVVVEKGRIRLRPPL